MWQIDLPTRAPLGEEMVRRLGSLECGWLMVVVVGVVKDKVMWVVVRANKEVVVVVVAVTTLKVEMEPSFCKDAPLLQEGQRLKRLYSSSDLTTCSVTTTIVEKLRHARSGFVQLWTVSMLKYEGQFRLLCPKNAQASVDTIMHAVSPQAQLILPILWNVLQDNTLQTRVYAMGHIKIFLEVHGSFARHSIESVGGVDTLEKCLKALEDANPSTQETTRQVFWIFDGVWQNWRCALIKQLEKACLSPELLAGLQTTTAQRPLLKKQRVAAAIAASRAKTKATATVIRC
ncbi:clasp N terminal-domain-containing protein [Cytidiella melzeri]|nr:clasp N terminal-domain-containing protein [Cytidiella melzeri]